MDRQVNICSSCVYPPQSRFLKQEDALSDGSGTKLTEDSLNVCFLMLLLLLLLAVVCLFLSFFLSCCLSLFVCLFVCLID